MKGVVVVVALLVVGAFAQSYQGEGEGAAAGGAAAGASGGGQGNVTILGDIRVTGAFRTTSIHAETLTVDGSMSITHGLSAESFRTTSAVVSTIDTMVVSSPTGTLHVQGELVLGDLTTNGTISATAFIQEDVRQWQLAFHDDFEQENTKGWNTDKTSTCDGNDHHLAGHCQHVGEEVKKTFGPFGEHKFLRLQARYHFLDSWEGELAFAKINDRMVWTEINDARDMHPNALSHCGGDHPDAKFSVPIDVTIPHTEDKVQISFGSNLDEHPCNESFGVDDVMVSIR